MRTLLPAALVLALSVSVATAKPRPAKAEMMMIPEVPVTIPTDHREVDPDRLSSRHPHGAAALEQFPHRPWLTGASIALSPDEKWLFVADADNGAVRLLDADSRALTRTWTLDGRPERLVVGPSGLAYVTLRQSRSVVTLDPAQAEPILRGAAGVEPWGLALTPDGTTLLVASSATSELLILDAGTLALQRRIEVAPWPVSVAAHPDGKRAYVTHQQGGTIEEIDLERGAIGRTLELPIGEARLPGRLLGRVMPKRVPNAALAATLTPGGTRLLVVHTMVDTGEGRQSFHVGSDGYGVGGARPIVMAMTAFDLESGEPQLPEVGPTTNDDGRFTELSQADLIVQQLHQPIALAHHPRLAAAWVVGQGSDSLTAFDTTLEEPLVRPLANVTVGAAPRGVAITRSGLRAFVHNGQSFDVSVVDLELGDPDAFVKAAHEELKSHRAGSALSFVAPERASFGADPLSKVAARGRRLFTYALDQKVGGFNQFACASCHLDGRSDGLVWHIGAGPRQTPILAGRVAQTKGPFNWLGTEDDLVDNIRQTIRRLGGSGVPDEDLRALAVYLSGHMPALDNPYLGTGGLASSAEVVAQGRALFNDSDVGCANCHAPDESFTDEAFHDVDTVGDEEATTLRKLIARRMDQQRQPQPPREPLPTLPLKFNTPSLTHLWASAPYYHDGSAGSLEQLLAAGNPGDRMGKTSHLTAAERAALTAYLRTL